MMVDQAQEQVLAISASSIFGSVKSPKVNPETKSDQLID
jgi:hypothetical protein